ncbi:alpha-amylase [bacterium]|nr:alpha-amylase [bacterium]
MSHIIRAKEMGFNWIYINPFHPTGSSGSIYAIKDHFGFNPLFFPDNNHSNPKGRLMRLIEETNKLGLGVMADLVINHTSKQSRLLHIHPDWYKRDEDGHILHPGAMDNGKMVYWKDLAEVDNLNSRDREALWSYWLSVSKHYIELGFNGFRCDAAYQVPPDLWRFIIQKIKDVSPHAIFFAETLGCTVEQTLDVANSGFDYIYNSFKWWDFEAPWFLDQHRQTQPFVPSVSFPESHDTKRLADELNDDIEAIKKRYLISALITKGVMTTMGFEFGFHKRLNVKSTKPEDWEKNRFDFRDFIRQTNMLKSSYRIFNQEARLETVTNGNTNLLMLLKSSEDGERCLFIINKSSISNQSLTLDTGEIFPEKDINDITDISLGDANIEANTKFSSHARDINLGPCQVKLFYQSPLHCCLKN